MACKKKCSKCKQALPKPKFKFDPKYQVKSDRVVGKRKFKA